MVKNTNTRLTITISKKQYRWLTELCKEKDMKMSKLISWLLYQKSVDVVNTRNLLEHPEEELSRIDEITEQEALEMFEKTKVPGQNFESYKGYLEATGRKII